MSATEDVITGSDSTNQVDAQTSNQPYSIHPLDPGMEELHHLLKSKGLDQEVLDQFDRSFVVSDPSLEDNLLVWVSSDFLSITGYSKSEVVGRNCRFLQGIDTRPEDIAIIPHFFFFL